MEMRAGRLEAMLRECSAYGLSVLLRSIFTNPQYSMNIFEYAVAARPRNAITPLKVKVKISTAMLALLGILVCIRESNKSHTARHCDDLHAPKLRAANGIQI